MAKKYYLCGKCHNMSHICNYQHIVFRTYKSKQTIPDIDKLILISYINKLCAANKIFVKASNAHRNHVHLLLDIPSTLSLEAVVTLIKTNTTKAFKGHRLFPSFEGWAKKYASFSVSFSHCDAVKNYIENQEKHHEGVAFYNELVRLMERNGLKPNEYFEQDFGKDETEEYCL